MATGAFTRFDIAERMAELQGFDLSDKGEWLELVLELWTNGPMQNPVGYEGTKPAGLLVPVEGGFSMEWIEAERSRVEMRKRAAIANGAKGGRPCKRRRITHRVIEETQPVTDTKTQPVKVKKTQPETQPVNVPEEQREPAVLLLTQKKVGDLIPPAGTREARPSRKPSKVVKVLFAESPVNTLELFEFAFSGDPVAEVVDLGHYFEAVKLWSAGKGEKRADWVAMAKSFMLRDKQAGKLVKRNAKGTEENDREQLEYLRT
jgi:hypothetical protein